MAVVTGLQNEYNVLTVDQTFVQRTEMAVMNAAQAIANETVGATPSPTDINHRPARMALCKAVSQSGGSASFAVAFAKLILAQGIDTASDIVIQNNVNAVWNTVAGPS